MLTKFRITIILILFFIIPNSYSYAKEYYHEWEYGIVEGSGKKSTEFFVDKEKTDLLIDHKKKEIKLFRETLGSPIKFTNEDNMPIAYSLLTEQGVKQFAFDGTEMVEVGSLKIEIENPLAMATKQNSPDLTVVYNNETNDENTIEYYGFDGFQMQGIPFLEIAGLKDTRSIAFLDDDVATVLTEDTLNVLRLDGKDMVDISYLKFDNLDNPLDIASDGKYNISLLSEEKITHFGFSGDGLVEIPALSIFIGNIEGVSSPRHIASVEGMVMFTDESKAYTFLQGSDQMHYVEALSVTSGLTSPMGLSINRNSNDVVILDELDDKAIVRYYRFDGASLVEVPQLSLELENIVLGGGGLYNLKGSLLSKPLIIKNDYADLFQVGIYASLEEDTSIKLFISNGYETDIEVEDENTWKPIWNLVKNKGDSEPTVYKNHGKDFMEDWKLYEGGLSQIYPGNIDTSLGIDTNLKLDDYEVIETEDGKLYLKPKKEDATSKWFKFDMPIDNIDLNMDSYVRFKMEFTSKEGKKTPKVFVPSERNEIKGIEDDVAIRILARKKPLIPVIDDINPEIPTEEELPKPPNNGGSIEFPAFPKPIAMPGWIYTTTPTITWHIPIIDKRDEEDKEIDGMGEEDRGVDDKYQMAYQLVLMALTDTGYKPAFITDKVIDSTSEPIEIVRDITIPTSSNPNIEGPLFASGSYRFIAFVRLWDPEGNPSEFSVGKSFSVLAYERPRIEKVESTSNGAMNNPTMIQQDMKTNELLKAKAGTAITFSVDAVGPIENDLNTDEDISIFYYTDVEGKDFLMEKGIKKSLYPAKKPINRFSIISWTPATVTSNVENSIVKVYLSGDSRIGGRTIFSIPNYAEGVVEINDTVYEDWQIFLGGRD